MADRCEPALLLCCARGPACLPAGRCPAPGPSCEGARSVERPIDWPSRYELFRLHHPSGRHG